MNPEMPNVRRAKVRDTLKAIRGLAARGWVSVGCRWEGWDVVHVWVRVKDAEGQIFEAVKEY